MSPVAERPQVGRAVLGEPWGQVTLGQLLLGIETGKSFRCEDRRLRLLTVGISRATRWIYLSTVRGYEFTEAQTLRHAAAAGDVFIREATVASGPGIQPAPLDPEEESFL